MLLNFFTIGDVIIRFRYVIFDSLIHVNLIFTDLSILKEEGTETLKSNKSGNGLKGVTFVTF